MKKFESVLFLFLLTVFAVSCSNDDDSSTVEINDTVEINGVTRNVVTIKDLVGSWAYGFGTFALVVNNKDNIANSLDYFMFNFQNESNLVKGDDVSKMTFTVYPPTDLTDEEYIYQSGKAIVMEANKEKNQMTLKFEQLKMAFEGDVYTINGTATLMYSFYN